MWDRSLSQRLTRDFYSRATARVARDLLGCQLVRVAEGGQFIGGEIVETEAYLASGDPASHAARGRSRRNASMFAHPGTLYVYQIHAKCCLNIVTEQAGVGTAVLIRALRPRWGVAQMQTARRQQDERRLTRGPAMICQALAVTIADDGLDLVDSPQLAVLPRSGQRPQIAAGVRVGISRGQDLPLRFCVAGSRYLSQPHRPTQH